MSKAQLHGIVGYTGFIRPSLQCTQLSALKPGKHANQAGSYIPQGTNPFISRDQELQITQRKATGPESMSKAQAQNLEEQNYANFQRQDRVFLENARSVVNRVPATTAHWKSMHVASFTNKSPDPNFTQSFRPERQPVLPQPVDPPKNDTKAKTFKDMCSAANEQVILGKPRPPLMSTCSMPRGEDMDCEIMDMAMTWPRKGSREQQTQRPPTEVRQRHYGTSKASNYPPGYMGFIPAPAAGQRAIEHGQGTVPRPTQRCKEDTLFDSYREKPVGYLGYAPTSVYNRRSWEIPDITTNGAVNQSMVGMGQVPKRPEAGGTSTLLDHSFSGPLDGRPSDNGVFNSQIYYKLVRPLEGAARSHIPSMTHPAGRKFLKPYLTLKNF